MEWADRYRQAKDDAPDLPATPDAVARSLLDGNARFIRRTAPDAVAPSTVAPADGTPITELPVVPVPKQAPFAVVLGCSDARVPMELVFDVKPNQLFVVRVAGNVLGAECLGSVEYALHSFKGVVHLAVVLGHTGCGAVGAAVDAYLSPKTHSSIAFTRSLRAVVDHVLLAVRSAALSLEQVWGADVATDPGYRAALAEAAVYLNAAMTAYQLKAEIGEDPAAVRVLYGVYDVASSHVIGPDLNPTTDDTSKLADPPDGPGSLVALGTQLAASPMVGRHLSAGRRPAGG